MFWYHHGTCDNKKDWHAEFALMHSHPFSKNYSQFLIIVESATTQVLLKQPKPNFILFCLNIGIVHLIAYPTTTEFLNKCRDIRNVSVC